MVRRSALWCAGALFVTLAQLALQAAPASRESTATGEARSNTGAVQVLDGVAYGRELVARCSPEQLRRYHDLIATEPHVAGSAGDARQVERIRQAFEAMGLATRVEPFRCLLAKPVSATLEIVERGSGEPSSAVGARRGVIPLAVSERNLLEDPATAHPDLTYGWNAYSGNGDVTAPLVYANYATREDFARLKALGVDVKGKIVIARYGKCFRGYKARFAEAAGAAGLIIYTDPADAGSVKGKVWPEGGGWANDACIQRGTLNTLPYPGDPGTPGVFSADNVLRDDPERLDLPHIPVQPIGYAAAGQLLARFSGAEAPEAWRGGLALPYRLDSGDGCQVRLAVQQQRFVGVSANVIATLPGAVHPEESVVIGCHHDAWGYGSADPGAGTMCLIEAARCVAELARQGVRPARSLVFAAWGAEEFGIIGSTEWVEAHDAEIRNSAVAYVNLDMAAMGPNPGMSISPDLAPAARIAASWVHAAGAPNETVLGRMERLTQGHALFGPLGGGSDHIGFVCRLGVPSISLSAGGSAGTSYHSNYDTVSWYRAVVGEDYASARMVTETALALLAVVAQEPLTPARVLPVARMALEQVDALEQRTKDPLFISQLRRLRPGFQTLADRGEAIDRAIDASPQLTAQNRMRVASGIRRFQQAFIDRDGLDGRPWFLSLLAASDRDDGYAACMLPLVSEALADADEIRLGKAVDRMIAAQRAAGDGLTQMESGLGLPVQR